MSYYSDDMMYDYDPYQQYYYHHDGRRGRTFDQRYRCRAASSSSSANPQIVEGSDKVVLPPSALSHLMSLRIEYPMLFAVHTDDAAQRVSHCGVLEFVAEEGTVVMPRWMMRNMFLEEGDAVRLRTAAALPKGTYVKLQPHTCDFLDVSNPKAVLERTLRNFACLTTGDTIMISYNDRQYYIDILETKPAAAVTIIDTDCEVDFAPPLDYKEPEKPKATAVGGGGDDAAAKDDEPKFKPFTGSGNRLDGKAAASVQEVVSSYVVVPASNKAPASQGGEDDAAAKGDEPKFKPFARSGKRLDGKATSTQKVPATTDARSAPSVSCTKGNQEVTAPTKFGGSNPTHQKPGKLVFGSGATTSKHEPKKAHVKEEEPPKKDEPKFQAFIGKSYSLMNS